MSIITYAHLMLRVGRLQRNQSGIMSICGEVLLSLNMLRSYAFQPIVRRMMKPLWLSLFAAGVVCFTFIVSMNAQQSPAERVTEIQAALREAKLDGWLFY